MSECPEHDKLVAVSEDSQAVGEFLDTCGYRLCEWRDAGNNGAPRYRWAPGTAVAPGSTPSHIDYWNGDAQNNPEFDEWDEGFYPVPGSIQRILSRYYGIDLDKIEAEKRAMLDAIRAGHDAPAEITADVTGEGWKPGP